LQLARAKIAAVLDHDREAAGPTHAAHRRRAEDGHGGVVDLPAELLAQLVGDSVAGQARVAAVGVVLEIDEHRAEVGPGGVQYERLATNAGDVPDAGRVEGNLLESPHHPLGALHRGGVGQLHVDHEV